MTCRLLKKASSRRYISRERSTDPDSARQYPRNVIRRKASARKIAQESSGEKLPHGMQMVLASWRRLFLEAPSAFLEAPRFLRRRSFLMKSPEGPRTPHLRISDPGCPFSCVSGENARKCRLCAQKRIRKRCRAPKLPERTEKRRKSLGESREKPEPSKRIHPPENSLRRPQTKTGTKEAPDPDRLRAGLTFRMVHILYANSDISDAVDGLFESYRRRSSGSAVDTRITHHYGGDPVGGIYPEMCAVRAAPAENA